MYDLCLPVCIIIVGSHVIAYTIQIGLIKTKLDLSADDGQLTQSDSSHAIEPGRI
jgi:hypothetical protein